jgi:hypothetical protein
LLYAQRADDIPQELIKKNNVKSMTTYLTTDTKGIDKRSFKDFAVGKVLYDRNGNEISDKTYIWWDVRDYIMADSTAYHKKNKVIERWSKQFISVTNNPNTFVKTVEPFADSQSKTVYEYDAKEKLIYLLSIGKEGRKVLKSYIYMTIQKI